MESVAFLSKRILRSEETVLQPKYAESMNRYISACQEDPELQSFDSALHQRTNKLVNSLDSRGGQAGSENLSLDALIEVSGFLAESGRDVAKIIIECKEVVSKNKELKSLIDLYYESTNKTLYLFNTVEKCVDKADNIQLLIRVAIKQFELDTKFERNEMKYVKTLEKLDKVKAMEDPFGDEFATQYEDVCAEQVMLLDKVRELQVMFEKKHKKSKKWRRLGNILFATAFFSVIALSIICSVTVVGIPVAASIGLTAATAVVTAGIRFNGNRKEYEKTLKARKEFLLLTEEKTRVNIESMETINNLVEALIIRISSIMKSAEVAVVEREEETVKLVMKEIIRKVQGFAEKIEEVGATVAECSQTVVSGRNVVLRYIANSP